MLEYHDVVDGDQPRDGQVTGRTFARHLRHLREHFTIVTLAEATRELRSRSPLQHDYLVITFDDGYADNYRVAWPLIAEHGLTATIFVTTGFLDGEPLWFDMARCCLRSISGGEVGPSVASRLTTALSEVFPDWRPDDGTAPEKTAARMKYASPPDRERLTTLMREMALREALAQPLSWEEARSIDRAGGEIGAHTISHPILSQLPACDQEREIVGSRDRVAAELSRAPVSFAYPNGSQRDFDAVTCNLVASAGFEAACTTVAGSNRAGCDPFRLHRLGVGEDTVAQLDARLAGLFDQRIRRPSIRIGAAKA